MTNDAHPPIGTDEANAALAGLARFDHVVLAVSGGPDSMALMVLAAEWAQCAAHPASKLSVATVDHGLRTSSRTEAEMVAAEAQRLGLPHVILTWEGEKPETGVPAAAREARYRLLEDHARTFGATRVAIVAAHHQDDQAETFAMRLARGAGVDGLAGMRSERPLRDGSPVVLVRPLLNFPKARLVATLAERNISYVDDPTNSDSRYERARVRVDLRAFESQGLPSRALAVSARRLGEASEALDYAGRHFAASLDLSYGNEVFARFDRHAFDAGPVFLRQKLLSRLIRRYGGASPAPQLSEVEDLVARMQREEASTATLGGAMISCGSRFIRVWREAGRLEEPEAALLPGQERLWDGRFRLKWSPQGGHSALDDAVTVKALGEDGYAAIVARLDPSCRPPSRAALALPSFWLDEAFLAAPSLAPFALSYAPPLDPAGCELDPVAASATF